MNYKDTIEYLYNVTPCFQQSGASAYKPGLERMLEMCQMIGNPQSRLQVIHVGGTNGKGSTTSSLASILTSAGYKVGLFTSPHLADFRERIRINGVCISEQEVVDFVARTRPMIEHVSPSFFEYTTLMAFDHFARHEVNFAVIEVGIGGRLDSTNVVTPCLSIVTNISLDHTQYLGDTLEKIAVEKAGIFKPNKPALVGCARGSVRSVFEQVAGRLGTPLTFCEDEHTIVRYDYTPEGLHLETVDYGPLDNTLSGEAQVENSRTILMALRILNEQVLDRSITAAQVQDGFTRLREQSGLRGRWERLSDHPMVICDTAHNPAGIAMVVEQLERLEYHNLYMIIGMSADKDVDTNLAMMPSLAHYFFCPTQSARTLSSEELVSRSNAVGLHGVSCTSLEEALNRVLRLAQDDDVIFIGGSNFVVAELLPIAGKYFSRQ